MKTLSRLLVAAAIAGAAVTALARLGWRAGSAGDRSNSPPLDKPETLRVPLGEILETQGTRLG